MVFRAFLFFEPANLPAGLMAGLCYIESQIDCIGIFLECAGPLQSGLYKIAKRFYVD